MRSDLSVVSSCGKNTSTSVCHNSESFLPLLPQLCVQQLRQIRACSMVNFICSSACRENAEVASLRRSRGQHLVDKKSKSSSATLGGSHGLVSICTCSSNLHCVATCCLRYWNRVQCIHFPTSVCLDTHEEHTHC